MMCVAFMVQVRAHLELEMEIQRYLMIIEIEAVIAGAVLAILVEDTQSESLHRLPIRADPAKKIVVITRFIGVRMSAHVVSVFVAGVRVNSVSLKKRLSHARADAGGNVVAIEQND